MAELTPRQIVAALDKYIIGQAAAKRAIAVAIRNRWRRLQLPEAMREEVGPKNILMIGPTGVGKTEIARRMAALVDAPFLKVEATKFTEVGYVGRDVDSIVRDLLELAIAMVQQEQTEVVREKATDLVEERLLDELIPQPAEMSSPEGVSEAEGRRQRTREKFRAQLRAGELEEKMVELRIEQKIAPMGMFATTMGPDQMGPEIQDLMDRLMPSQAKDRKVTIREARKILFAQESEKLIDRDKVKEMAIQRAQSSGIVFIDEMDKLCGNRQSSSSADVSRQGVQRDLLPIIEGSTVNTRHGPVKTDHILFVAAGAFHSAKPSELMPELQGRLPIRVELDDLTKEDFRRILTEPENALTKQQVALMATEGVELRITSDAVDALAEIAANVNQTTENIGARRLHTIMEKVIESLSFDAPEMSGKAVVIDASYVNDRLAEIVKDEDLSKFIL
ncbi:MAG: ATP-dependent protease ATPase subunit HslU [Planctomycetia bacterium]|jgi:ATP-dependent HslUV protease ATP-binding subunit HslU|nr:ATP-dependent protease ATPase subunit HslU [Planctomycetia bacterium]MCC7316120.1 ATP-dependent protease ATPase subunit HslU [Planctomycetota bacterium]OQZ01091.1 MAG: HslU--HslV peptidase ATPase subunit [Planctomycetes bacterium UTPLA1]